MKTVYKLFFGVVEMKGDIEYWRIIFEVIASTILMASFIRAIEEQTCTELLYKEEEILEPYHHQTIMDI